MGLPRRTIIPPPRPSGCRTKSSIHATLLNFHEYSSSRSNIIFNFRFLTFFSLELSQRSLARGSPAKLESWRESDLLRDVGLHFHSRNSEWITLRFLRTVTSPGKPSSTGETIKQLNDRRRRPSWRFDHFIRYSSSSSFPETDRW